MGKLDYEDIIIGGGAAGLMCAAEAGRRGRRVWVVEHANKLGKKILMSGGGRCNFTNLHTSPENFLSGNPHFCRSALARYTQWDFIAMVQAHGIAYHEKELGQLFCDQSSKQILAMLVTECQAVNVRLSTGTSVSSVRATQPGFELQTTAGTVRCERLVIATGGLSIPKMGASGFGYDLARQFGHSVVSTRAGLVPLTLSGRPLEQIDGLAGVATPVVAQTPEQSFSNAALFTHRGLSGPAVLQISSYWQPGTPLHMNWLPGIDAAQQLLEAKRTRPQTRLESLLQEFLPKRLAIRLAEWCEPGSSTGAPLQALTDEAAQALGRRLQHWPIQASGTEGYRTAEVTLGGVDTHELSSQSLMSNFQPGLHFIGEVVDVTGHLGGFNFQWAWSSAVAAANAC